MKKEYIEREELVKTKEVVFTFTRVEVTTLLSALDYVHHRQSEHNKALIIKPEMVDKMRSEMRNAMGI